jgi:uncharacterized membrane protein YcaP (DUF421 family)
MSLALAIDWRTLFVPTVHPGEIFFRGSVVYLFIFAAMRLFRRQAGTLGISDLLVVVLIADAVQNAMASEYKSITDGLLLVATILFWEYALDWLAYRYPRVRPLLQSGPLLLIENGRLQAEHLRKHMVSEDELLAQLREHGLESADQVKRSYLEGDGRISVIRAGPRTDQPSEPEDRRSRQGNR